MKTYNMKEASELLGVTYRTIRYYKDKDASSPPEVNPGDQALSSQAKAAKKKRRNKINE